MAWKLDMWEFLVSNQLGEILGNPGICDQYLPSFDDWWKKKS